MKIFLCVFIALMVFSALVNLRILVHGKSSPERPGARALAVVMDFVLGTWALLILLGHIA